MSPSRFRVFVAMPGSMPEDAAWTDVEDIKKQLFGEPGTKGELQRELERLLKRPVKIVVETDKVRTGDIHESMWRETLEADAYIADLTGANANVYMELGVRWAISEGPTVLICQNKDVRFNAQNARVIQYGPKFDQVRDAVGKIAEAILEGLNQPEFCDSPVLRRLEARVVSRARYNELLSEKEELAEQNKRLKEEKAEELIRAAEAAEDLDERISRLVEATNRAPGNEVVWYRLGMTRLEVGRNAEATDALERATRLKEKDPELWLQLAIARSRAGELKRAEDALDRALTLEPNNADAWATRGGNYRRMAREQGTEPDWDLMAKARDAYQEAATIRKNDSYLELNVAQLDLLLSRGDPGLCEQARVRLRNLEGLVSYEIEWARSAEDPNGVDPWNPFKLVTIQALTGRYGEAVAQVAKAVEPIAPAARRSYVESTVGPLEDFRAAEVLEQDAVAGLQRVIGTLRRAADLPDATAGLA